MHHQEKDYMFFFYIMKNCLILLLSKEQDRVATGVFWDFGKAIKKEKNLNIIHSVAICIRET